MEVDRTHRKHLMNRDTFLRIRLSLVLVNAGPDWTFQGHFNGVNVTGTATCTCQDFLA
jgi:hypothetical protein